MNPNLDEFKALGIDYGEKRIGIALSELNGKFAIPHSILQYKNIEFALNEIKKISNENNISLIVIGLPITLKNELGFKAKEVMKFKTSLQKLVATDIVLEDERLSTAQAIRAISPKSKRKYVDDSSATIILNSFLRKRSNRDE